MKENKNILKIAIAALFFMFSYGIAGNFDALSVNLKNNSNVNIPVPVRATVVDKGVVDKDYINAVKKFEEYRNSKLPGIKNEYNLPFILTHGYKTDDVILMIHGLTDSPWYMKKAGEILYSLGYNVVAILLPGHGTKPEDLLRIKAKQWQRDADIGLEIAKGLGRNISLSGFSTGGALSLDLIRRHPGLKVKNLVFFSPALSIKEKEHLKLAVGCIAPNITEHFMGQYVKETIGPENSPYRYRKMAINSVCQLYRVTRYIDYGQNRRILSSINRNNTGVFIVATESDTQVSIKAIDKFVSKIKNKSNVVYIKYPKSYNVAHADTPRPETNPYFNELKLKLIDFIKSRR